MTKRQIELTRCYDRAHARRCGDLTYFGTHCRKFPDHSYVRMTQTGRCADCHEEKVSDVTRWKRISLGRAITLDERDQLNAWSIDGTIGQMLLDLLATFPGGAA